MPSFKWKKPVWKATYYMIPTIEHSGGQNMDTVKTLLVVELE